MNKSHLTYFNPNPLFKEPKAGKKPKVWRIGDCAVRAVCAATGMSWEAAYLTMSDSAMKAYAPFNTSEGFDQVMIDLGFKKVSYKKGQKRETANVFAENHPNVTAILNLAGHYVCVKNGEILDTWDCGWKTAYNYWVK